MDNNESQMDALAEHPSSLQEFALAKLRQVEKEDEEEELSRIRKFTMNLQYYRGLQRGFFDSLTGDWRPIDWTIQADPRVQAVLLSDNIFRPQIKALIKEWSRSRTKLNVRSRNNSRRNQAAARFASEALELFQNKIQTESFRQQEGKWSTLCGNYFRHTLLTKDQKRSPKVKIPQTETVQISPETFACLNSECGYESTSDIGDTVCPACGSEIEHREAVMGERINGYVAVSVGEPSTILVDPRQVKIPLSTRKMQDHSYLRWKRIDELMRVQRKYRRTDLKGGLSSEVSRYYDETERSSGATDVSLFDGAGNSAYQIEEDYLWLKPDQYFNVVFHLEQRLGDFVVQAEVPLDEQFPDGIRFNIADNKLLHACEEDLSDYWSHGTYDELPETAYGDGNDDAILDQNRYNELRAMQMENALFNSFSKTVVNTKIIDPSLLANNADFIPLNQNATTDLKIDENAFGVIPANQLSPEIAPLAQSIESSMRSKTAAHLAMSGENDPDVDTATGMSILRDAAVATLGLALALRSEVDVEWSYQILEIVQRNWVAEYHTKMLGDYSVREAEAFAECDIRNDLEITVQANSWIPRTEEEERSDFVAYVTAGGLPLGFANPDLPLEVQEQAADVFRSPLQLNRIQPDVRVAELRIDELLDLSEQLPRPHETEDLTPEMAEEVEAAYQQSAMLLAGKIEVRPYVDDHAIIAQVYRRWLKEDAGLHAHPVVKDAVEILIQRHRDADRQLQMEVQSEMAEDQMMSASAQSAQDAEIQEANPTGQPGKPNGVSPQLPAYEIGNRVEEGNVAVPQ